MRILVTGGAGFIGQNLCAALIKEGHMVRVVDNLVTGRKKQVPRECRFSEIDICDAKKVEQLYAYEPQRVYHLACIASPQHYQMYPLHTLSTSFVGTRNILDLTQATGARVLFTSTSEIYGDPLVHPQREDYWGNVNPWGPRCCYDEGKRVAESLIWTYRDRLDTDVRVARVFNTYGPGMNPQDGRAVPNFITEMLNDEPLTVYGSGEQTRSLCYIDDMVRGLIALMEYPIVSAPVNLGNPDEITMINLARKIAEIGGKTFVATFENLPQDDPRCRCPDITRAKELLKWEPTTSLDDGLRATIDYFRREYGW